MVLLVLIFALLHVVFNMYLFFGWRSISESEHKSSELGFSIIIPVRNEEQVIERLLTSLAYQDYPKEQFEVLVIDDFSEDETRQVVEKCQDLLDINLKLIPLEELHKSGKKHALTKGVNEASNEHIITTDADCQMGPLWLAAYAAGFGDNRFVAGPVAIKGGGLFAKLQQIEFSGLIGFGAVTLERNDPSMCSGANLGFTKSTFHAVGGYENNIQLPSGDDEFLLYNVLKKFPRSASFLKNKAAIVLTPAHHSFKAFVNQRKRWTSKWKYNKNLKLRFMAILFFLDYMIFLGLLAACFLNAFAWEITLVIVATRLLSDYLVTRSVSQFLGNKASIWTLMIMQIIYPMHVLLMGVNSIFGNYTWKGRKY